MKRDAILEIEKEVQLRWAKERVFELDAPKVRLYGSHNAVHACMFIAYVRTCIAMGTYFMYTHMFIFYVHTHARNTRRVRQEKSSGNRTVM